MKYNPLYNKVGKNLISSLLLIKEGLKIKNRKIIIIVIVIIIAFSKNSLAKYIKNTQISVDAKILEPIIEIKEENTININSNDTKICNFKIKNFNNQEKINEVCLEYYIEFINNVSEIINCKIYKNNEEIKLNDNKTEKFSLETKAKQEDEYNIEILVNDTYLKEISDIIKIKIYFEQKD